MVSHIDKFVPNTEAGLYHPDNEINKLITSSKGNDEYDEDLKGCIIKLEEAQGARGTCHFIHILNEYEHSRLSFDDAVLQYLSYPILERCAPNNEVDEQYNLLFNQKLAYETNDEEEATKFSISQVKYYIQNEIFRNVIFPSDSKQNFLKPSFVMMGNETVEDIPQCVTICNILLKRLGKEEYTVEEKVKWWIGHGKYVYNHFSKLRCQVVRNMFTTFVALHKKEYKNRNCDNYDTPLGMLRLLPGGNDRFAEELLDLNVEKDTYRAFLDVCVAGFFSKGCFSQKMKEHLLSKLVTVTEEAFALLSLENNIQRWEWMANTTDVDDDNLAVPTEKDPPDLLYQSNPQLRKDSKISAGPWKREGLERMNDLLEKVLKAREDRREFEKDIQKMYRMGCTSEEVTKGWLLTENAKKKRRLDHISVKNFLNTTEV